LSVYDSSGLQVFNSAAGSAVSALTDVNLSQDPWDPSQGPLLLSQGSWSFSYSGHDSSGAVLRNGIYLLVLVNQDGSRVQKALQIVGAGAGRVSVSLQPNPVRPGTTQVRLLWSPVRMVELKVYSLDGGLVRDFGLAGPPQDWDLHSGNGNSVANGIYWVIARVPGERSPQVAKLMIAR
jgi:hypothetical protein